MSKKTHSLAAICSVTTALVALPTAAHAGPCDAVTKYTQDVWGNLNKVADQACKDGSDCRTAQAKLQTIYAEADKIVKWWNQMTKGTWAQLGPRNFDFGQKNTGKLVAPGDRTWISTMPSRKNAVEVTLKKTDGKGYAVISICAADEGGKPTLMQEVELKENGTIKKTISGVEGKVVTVRLDGKGGLGKATAYELEVK
jgi:hypothetical protein